MATQDQIHQTIYAAIDELNEQLPGKGQIAKTPASVLFGPSGALDSLSLVNFIFAVEQNIEKQLGKSVNLTDREALSQHNSPFQTVATLTDYIQQLLTASSNG